MFNHFRILIALLLGFAGAASPSHAQSLRYAPEKGQSFTYDFEIEVNGPSVVTKFNGSTSYLVDMVDDNQLKLTYHGGLLESVKRKQSSSDFPSFPAVPKPRFPIGGPFETTQFKGTIQTTHPITISRQGKVLKMEGDSQLPFLLGNLSLLPFEPLPTEGEQSWTEDLGTIVNSTSESPRMRFGFHAPFGPFSHKESKTIQPATEKANYSLEKKDDQSIVFKKSYRLQTAATQDIASLEMSGEGTWTFNRKDRFPDSLDMRLALKHNEDNVSITLPMTVTYKRVSPEALALRVAEAKQKAAQAKEYAEQPITASVKKELLKSLESNDPIEVKNALDKLAKKTNVSSDMEIAKSVEKLLKHPSLLVVLAAEKALPIWSPTYSKTYEINKRYRGPLHVDSTGQAVDKSTPLFVGQIVQVQEFGTAWMAAKIQKLLSDGQVEVGVLMDGRVIRSLSLARKSIQLAPDEVEQPDRPEPPSSASTAREWSDRTGKFRVLARFIKLVDGIVFLQTEEGKELKIMLNRLSDSDKSFALEASEDSEDPFKS